MVELDALGDRQRVRVVHEHLLQRFERRLPLFATEVPGRAAALRLEVRGIDLGGLGVGLLRLLGFAEQRGRFAEAAEPLELHFFVGGLAREHLEDGHEVGVLLGIPQELGDALTGFDVLGVDGQGVEIELGRALVIVEAVEDLAGLDEEARALEAVAGVRHRFDQQLRGAEKLAVLAVNLDQAKHRGHVRRVDAERACEAILGALLVADVLREIAGLVQELDLLTLELRRLRATFGKLDGLEPLLGLFVEARQLTLTLGVVRDQALGLGVGGDRALDIAQLAIAHFTDLREQLGAHRRRHDLRVTLQRVDELFPVALDAINA